MSDLKINELTGDLELTSGDVSLTTGSDSIDQHIRSNIRAFRGEWFLNLDDGVPYFQEVFKKNQSPAVVDAIFKEAILKTTGVIELTEFEINYDTDKRKLILDFSVNTVEGEINFDGLEVE